MAAAAGRAIATTGSRGLDRQPDHRPAGRCRVRQSVVEQGDRQERRRRGDPRTLADHRRLERSAVGLEPDDHRVVGPGPDPQLLDDRVDDRIGRDGAGEALEDPGEGLGLGAAALLEGADRSLVEDCREAGQDDEPGKDPIEEPRAARQEADQGDEPEDEEGAEEEPPSTSDATIRGAGSASG